MELRPQLGDAATALTQAVYASTTFSQRVAETRAVPHRADERLSQLTELWRSVGHGHGIIADVYDQIGELRESPLFTDAERVAIEHAELFARHLAFGRQTRVLGLDQACPLPRTGREPPP